jgi:hypothetical protein
MSLYRGKIEKRLMESYWSEDEVVKEREGGTYMAAARVRKKWDGYLVLLGFIYLFMGWASKAQINTGSKFFYFSWCKKV